MGNVIASMNRAAKLLMKILYHHRTRSEDAQGIHINEMVKAFRDLGHEVEMVALVTKKAADGKQALGSAWGWLTRGVPAWLYELMSLVYNLYGYRQLCQAIRSKKPDLIYERYALNTFCGIWASRRFGIPIVLEVNAPLYYEQSQLGQLTFRRLARFSERWICSRSTWTVVVSKVMKDILVQEGVPSEKVVVMPNGIDPQTFHPHVCGKEIRRRYNLEGKLVVGFVGWFRKWHGLEMLLEIMHESRLAQSGVRLLLVGDGPALPALHHYVQAQGLQSAVILTGPIDRQDVSAYIAAMDIAVQPGVTEYACPMKLFEYMGMGKCIVAPNQPNIREILTHGINGYLFQPGDREHFRRILSEAILKSAWREAVGRQAHETIYRRGYLWSSNAQKALALVLGNAPLENKSV
jgi:glycosyltransferase involved in cell wall biosynthesis